MGLFSIERSQRAYRADFCFYGGLVMALSILLIWRAPEKQALSLSLLVMTGLASWSLLEYLLHRHVLHGLQPFARWHAAHHAQPRARIGAPTPLTAALFVGLVFLPAWSWSDAWHACALTLGLVTGYLGYSFTHHAVHHWHGHSYWLRQRKLAHGLHHHGQRLTGPPVTGRYGVTSSFWDRVFGS